MLSYITPLSLQCLHILIWFGVTFVRLNIFNTSQKLCFYLLTHACEICLNYYLAEVKCLMNCSNRYITWQFHHPELQWTRLAKSEYLMPPSINVKHTAFIKIEAILLLCSLNMVDHWSLYKMYQYHICYSICHHIHEPEMYQLDLHVAITRDDCVQFGQPSNSVTTQLLCYSPHNDRFLWSVDRPQLSFPVQSQ